MRKYFEYTLCPRSSGLLEIRIILIYKRQQGSGSWKPKQNKEKGWKIERRACLCSLLGFVFSLGRTMKSLRSYRRWSWQSELSCMSASTHQETHEPLPHATFIHHTLLCKHQHQGHPFTFPLTRHTELFPKQNF